MRSRMARRSIVGLLALSMLVVAAPAAKAADYPINAPAGFFTEQIGSAIPLIIDFDFVGADTVFVATKAGQVRVIQSGTLLGQPFIDIGPDVNNRHDRGLLGIAVHPEFPAEPYIYLLFTHDPPEAATASGAAARDGNGARVSRLVRYTADIEHDYLRAVPGSALVLVGTNSVWDTISDPAVRNPSNPSCAEATTSDPSIAIDNGYVRDCIPADEQSHTIGTVMFDNDGNLLVGSGDGSDYTRVRAYATRALDIDSLAGKILRIDPNTGEGVPGNPHFQPSDPTSNRSRVFASGLRNPFRFTVNPATGDAWIGDVGWGTWEEVNVGSHDFGWPCYEGANGVLARSGYQNTSYCQSYYSANNAQPALYAYDHSAGGGSIQADAFFVGDAYPATYDGRFFYHDFNRRQIFTMSFNGDGSVDNPAELFATHGDSSSYGITQMKMGNDGVLWFSDIYQSGIYRLDHAGADNLPPVAAATASPSIGVAPLTVSFDATGSSDPDGDPLTYEWNFGDGSGDTGPTPTHEYTVAGIYTAVVKVRDPSGALDTQHVVIEIDTAPEPEITTPTDGSMFFVGDTVDFSGFATDAEDGDIPAEDLEWTLDIVHNDHRHPNGLPPDTTGFSGSFVMENHGTDPWNYELCLEATDADDASTTICVDIFRDNRPPALDPIADQANQVGDSVSLATVATDADGDQVSYSASGLPDGLSINALSGTISGAPTTDGVFAVTVTAADGLGGSDDTSFTWTVSALPAAELVNGSFETPVTVTVWERLTAAQVDGWSTLSGGFDMWSTGWNGPASDGDQFTELNTNQTDGIYQDFATTPGQTLHWSFDHRGRLDDDTVQLHLGAPGALTLQTEHTTPTGTWTTYTGSYTVPAGQTITRIQLQATDPGSAGNFVDNVVISDTPPPPPPPVGEFTNGSFETPVTATVWERLTAAQVDGWSTLSGGFDMWSTGWNGPASDGDQFTELNTNQTDGIYQDFATTPGQTLHWSFDHRGRLDDDTVQLHLGAPGALTLQTEHTTPTGTWTTYTGSYTVPAGQTITRIQLQATDPGSAGNFVDNVVISDTPPPPPPPVGEFTNGSFETPVTVTVWERLTAAQVDGWSTLSGGFDMWSTGWNGPASDGDQFTELNTNQTDGIYQDFATTPGQTLHWSFDHRGRLDDDTVQLHLGAPGALTLQTQHTTPTGTWTTYTGSYTIPAGQTITRIQLQATDPGSAGNFIDNITITTN